MAFRFVHGRIVGPRGDTGLLTFAGKAKNHAFTAADRFVFTLCSKSGDVLMHRVLPIGADGRVQVAFSHEDTRALSEGTYWWSVRYVLDAQIGEDGAVNGGREVDTPLRCCEFEVQKVVGEL